jgi:hypothetical protein
VINTKPNIRGIVDAPLYNRNDNLNKDLNVETVDSVNKKYAKVMNNDFNGTST